MFSEEDSSILQSFKLSMAMFMVQIWKYVVKV
jgi:hypothetical protein